MPIAACHLTSEGIVLGADSSAAKNGRSVSRQAQGLFRIGGSASLGALFWSTPPAGGPSARALVAQLSEAFERHTPRTLEAAAEHAAQIVRDMLRHEDDDAARSPSRSGRRRRGRRRGHRAGGRGSGPGDDPPAVGLCIAGHAPGDFHQPRAFEIAARIGERTSVRVRELPRGLTCWGWSPLVGRVLRGIDDSTLARIASSRRWKGSERELLALIEPGCVGPCDEMALAAALDWVHTLIFTSVHTAAALGDSAAALDPIHLAFIPADGRFRWVRHEEPERVVTLRQGPVLNRSSSAPRLPPTLSPPAPLWVAELNLLHTSTPSPLREAAAEALPHTGPTPPPLAPDPPAEPRTHRLRKSLFLTCLTLLVIVAAVGVAAKTASDLPPAWWRSMRTDDPAIVQTARDFQNAVLTELHWADREPDPDFVPKKPRELRSEPWALTLNADEVNAWLNVEFPKWLASRGGPGAWPEEIQDPQVSFSEGSARFGVRVVGTKRDWYVSTKLRLTVDAAGDLWASTDWVRIGRLPVPVEWAVTGSGSAWEEELGTVLAEGARARGALEALRGRVPLLSPASVHLEDGREVEVLEIRAMEGKLEVVCRTKRE